MLKIKTLLLTVFSGLMPILSFAQNQGEEMSLDQKIDSFFRPIADAVGAVIFFPITFGGYSVPIVLIVLIGGALYFTIYFKFANFTLLKTAIKIVKGDYDGIDKHTADLAEGDPTPGGNVFETVQHERSEGEGEVSHFQALTAALSATVGLGNIAGLQLP